ncbi:MAG: hypothetical protein H5T97_09990 [Firmicutes bacterium]|nr:hypothetical protein [Bacillota bacterium]
MRRLFGKAKELALRFWANERGSLDQLVWIIGAAVVVVLIVAGLMVFARPTVETIWQDFIRYMRSTFGF